LSANNNKKDRKGTEADKVNCNICDVQFEILDLDHHLASPFHLGNLDQLDTKFDSITSSTAPIQLSVLGKWLQSISKKESESKI
jgi:hypothetical protein